MYKDYVDAIFFATHLDRNQIIRAALFAAAHSPEFLKLMEKNKRGDVPLPSSKWGLDQAELWRDQNPRLEEKEGDVSVKGRKDKNDNGDLGREQQKESSEELRRQRENERRIREIQPGGGIKIRIS